MRRLAALMLVLAACGESTTPNSGFAWPRTSATQAGLDTARLSAMVRHIEQDLPNMNALVVVRGGRLAFEWYYGGRDGFATYDTRSVTKSWVSAFVGIALYQGWITSLDQRVIEFFPEVLDDPDVDPRISDVTLRHLMTMSAGIEEEQSNRFPLGSTDFVEHLLGTPLLFDPGSRFQYDGAQPHILSGLITRVRGTNLAEIANQHLFPDMNITHGAWHQDADGVSNGGTGLHMGALDLAKLGELFLRDGVWNGTRYLPPGFAEATAGTVSFPLPGEFADYAHLWWTTDQYGPRMWIAAGYRGQFVIVIPSLDMVVVIQSESYDLRGEVEGPFHLLLDFVLPAVK